MAGVISATQLTFGSTVTVTAALARIIDCSENESCVISVVAPRYLPLLSTGPVYELGVVSSFVRRPTSFYPSEDDRRHPFLRLNSVPFYTHDTLLYLIHNFVCSSNALRVLAQDLPCSFSFSLSSSSGVWDIPHFHVPYFCSYIAILEYIIHVSIEYLTFTFHGKKNKCGTARDDTCSRNVSTNVPCLH